MTANGNIAFGICPESACDRSYRKGQSLRAGLQNWRNAARFPASAEFATLDQRILAACKAVLQARPHPRGSCESCGKPLVFSELIPELGECSLCRRPYAEDDLDRLGCPACDAPVEILDEVKSRMTAYAAISEILHVIPHLKHYGYLAFFGADPR